MTKLYITNGLQKENSGGVTVSKLDLQTYTCEFESHWAPHSFGLVPHQSKALCKLLKLYITTGISWVLTLFIAFNSVLNMHIYPTLPLGLDMTQGQFVSEV